MSHRLLTREESNALTLFVAETLRLCSEKGVPFRRVTLVPSDGQFGAGVDVEFGKPPPDNKQNRHTMVFLDLLVHNYPAAYAQHAVADAEKHLPKD